MDLGSIAARVSGKSARERSMAGDEGRRWICSSSEQCNLKPKHAALFESVLAI